MANNEKVVALAVTAKDMIRSVHSPLIAKKAQEIASANPAEEMRSGFMDFFKGRIAAVGRAESVREKAYAAIEKDLESDDLTTEQKLSILMRLSRDSNELSDSLISMFRPAGGQSGSPLADIFQSVSEGKSDVARAFEGYSSEDLRRIDDTFKVIRDIVESGGGQVSITDGSGNTTPQAEV